MCICGVGARVGGVPTNGALPRNGVRGGQAAEAEGGGPPGRRVRARRPSRSSRDRKSRAPARGEGEVTSGDALVTSGDGVVTSGEEQAAVAAPASPSTGQATAPAPAPAGGPSPNTRRKQRMLYNSSRARILERVPSPQRHRYRPPAESQVEISR